MSTAVALYDYDPTDEGAISLQEGDNVDITAPEDGGWIHGINQRTGEEGFFPASYVELQEEGAEVPDAEVPQEEGDIMKVKFSNANLASDRKINTKAASHKPVRVKITSNEPSKKSTVFGIYAGILAQFASILTGATGVVMLHWYSNDTHPRPGGGEKNASEYTLAMGLFCLIVGPVLLFLEKRNIKTERKARFPRRLFAYIPLTLFLCTAFPTIILAFFWAGICGVWLMAFRAGEDYKPPRVRQVKDEYGDQLTKQEKCFQLIGGRNPEGRVGRVFTAVVYVLLNIFFGTLFYRNAADDINFATDLGSEAMSGWIPWAKFFGAMMDLNFTLIFLPVAHTVIKSIFAVSTDQTNSAKCIRKILYLIPLDQALKFHKLCGVVGAVCAVMHTVCHLLNFGLRPVLVWDTYGIGVWVTGTCLLGIIFMLVPATRHQVKSGQFEIFWFTHFFWIAFVLLNFFHGADWWGPNYWKFFAFPGGIFISERAWREYKRRQACRIWSFTRMQNPDVMSLAFCKDGPLANVRNSSGQLVPLHREGQYAFINCPAVSSFEWHPMTISAAPHEKHITFHIRVQKEGSWTRQVMEHMRLYAANKNYHEFLEKGNTPGMTIGITGQKLFCIDGPYSAPTQHLKEYKEVMVCASGIGVTPLSATMKSVVHHIWPRSSGQSFPSGANFFWVCSYNDITSFKWFLRTIREACDAYYQWEKNGIMKDKHFTFHLYITSYKRAVDANKVRESDLDVPDLVEPMTADEKTKLSPEDKKERQAAIEADTAFWGKSRPEDKKVVSQKSPFTEKDIWLACVRPDEKKRCFGPLTIYNGRPNWKEAYEGVNTAAMKDGREVGTDSVGVMFCGNPAIGKTLKNLCDTYTKNPQTLNFNLHKEVF